MELKNIIYNNLIHLVFELTSNGSQFEEFYNSLETEDKRNELLGLSDEIDNELKAIKKSKLEAKVHSDFDNLIGLLNTFKNNFNEFPSKRISESIVIIYLINYLNEALDEEVNLEEEIDISAFSFVKLSKEINQRNFAFHDLVDLKNSLVLVDLGNTDLMNEYFTQNPLSKELIIQLISKIGEIDKELELSQFVLVDKDVENSANQIWSFVTLHVVKNGKLIHNPYSYQQIPTISNSRKIKQEIKYQQFDDSILILSEYNHQTDILDKYLRIYHLLENFMYKYPLSNLERKYDGRVFSIRDFQKMNDLVSNGELKSLKNLFNEIVKNDYEAGIKFSDFIFQKWNGLHPNHIDDKVKIDTLLSELRVKMTYDSVEENSIGGFFANLIYALRNALVHNRETEFHLTHETLLSHSQVQDTALQLLEKFILPIVEEIVFYLIIEQNEIVWFKNSTIQLYKEH
ncbi:hypothetical protein [Constantimarinum furrinae]|uniref:Uncharacterized protein n=1 Tax=Constantimarinum furrinae TaxID=2562285 RepID=A0A7G8PXD3_9FLAO|nr:hypothetical protein [Constantimarinum furrinae]QNJ98999.1 hypothetical protein ALE3EI_2463 [Constantimarinum furrinae]